MKKIWLILVGIILIGAGIFGFTKFKETFGPVHGLIVYSSDKQKLDDKLKQNDKYIATQFTVEAKYSPKSDTLILNEQAAGDLIKIKALNKVTQKSDKFTFKPITSLPKTPILWSKKDEATLSDEKGNNISASSHGYVVLGESSQTSKILILDKKAYASFEAPTEYVSVIKEKRAADNALENYLIKNQTHQITNQIFHYQN